MEVIKLKEYIIKIWEDEDRRNIGESDIIEVGIENLKDAISKAKKIKEEQDYASIEVQDSDERVSYYSATPKHEMYIYMFRIEHPNEDIKSIVELYFIEQDLKNLMDYGSDRDSYAMLSISDLYKELLQKIGIKYYEITTDDVSDGKFETRIQFPDDSVMYVDTKAWNEEKDIIDNITSIYEEYEKIKENIEEMELDY